LSGRYRFAYRFGGKQKLLAIGSYPATSLADARLTRDEAKRLLEADYDPSTHKRKEAEAETNTFRTIAGAQVFGLRSRDAPMPQSKKQNGC
jgi:hypothetical protein